MCDYIFSTSTVIKTKVFQASYFQTTQLHTLLYSIDFCSVSSVRLFVQLCCRQPCWLSVCRPLLCVCLLFSKFALLNLAGTIVVIKSATFSQSWWWHSLKQLTISPILRMTTALTLMLPDNGTRKCKLLMFHMQEQQDTAFRMGLDISEIMDYTSMLNIRKGSFLSDCRQMMELLEEGAFGYVTKYLWHGGC